MSSDSLANSYKLFILRNIFWKNCSNTCSYGKPISLHGQKKGWIHEHRISNNVFKWTSRNVKLHSWTSQDYFLFLFASFNVLIVSWASRNKGKKTSFQSITKMVIFWSFCGWVSHSWMVLVSFSRKFVLFLNITKKNLL